MTARAGFVNLDAMIERADFATEGQDLDTTFEKLGSIAIRDLDSGSLIVPSLRKPDFQRETNHWMPRQICSLLECFANGDLIPSVILWKSPRYLFVIDGGHRLSALKAWVEDDYGDGPSSLKFFRGNIPNSQRRAAEATRKLVTQAIGTWQHFQTRSGALDLTDDERRRVLTIGSRALQIQWVQGNAEKAEASFFRINTQGTPLDQIEQLLLANRRKPIAIASRATIRAGTGHKYWSMFSPERQLAIELLAKELNNTLLEPEASTPIKTLDLPLGGPAGVRSALQAMMEFILVANRDPGGNPKSIGEQPDDIDGTSTVGALKRAVSLAGWMTGNSKGSLGLHPAVYFYGPTGRHQAPMFMGTAVLFARKLSNNDKAFFSTFTSVRSKLEAALIGQKDLVASLLANTVSGKRIDQYANMLESAVKLLTTADTLTDEDLVSFANLTGKIVVGQERKTAREFSDDTKSQMFISQSLARAMVCPICNGYLDPQKSLSYDHKVRVREGGVGNVDNGQLTHPYCNQAVKN